MATKQQLKDAIQRALDDDNLEAASELRARYLALEQEEQPQEVEQPKPEVIEEQPKKDLSWFDEFEFAYDSSHSDVANWGLALEAYSPMGRITIGGEDGLVSYQSPVELYGDEFMDMDYDQRRDFLLNRRDQMVAEEHKDTIILQEEQGKSATAEILGGLTGMLMSPTTLAPVGKGVIGAAKAGGLLGLELEAAEQTAEGSLDLVDLAKAGTIGAVGSAGITKAAQATNNAVKLVLAKKKAKKTQQQIDNVSSKVEDELATGVSQGLSPKENWARARRNLGLSSSEVADLAAHGKVSFPSPEQAAQIATAKANPIPALHSARKAMDALLAPISTVVRNIDESTFGRLRKFEFDTHFGIQQKVAEVSDFMTLGSKARKGKHSAQYSEFESALFNGNFQKANNIARVYFPELLEPLQKVTGPEGVLNVLHKELKASGVDVGFLENYFPRVVKDLTGLLNSVGKEKKTLLEKALTQEAKNQKLASWQELDSNTVSDVINKVLRGGKRSNYKIGLAQQRSIAEVDQTLKDFYYSAPESLNFYITSAIKEIEKRRFFGKNVVLDENKKVDLQQSIGRYVGESLESGKISFEQADELSQVLTARFIMGEKSGSSIVVGAKDIQTATLLGQFDSAVIQLADIGASVYMNGFKNTIKSLIPAARKRTETSAEDFGVINNISADINTNGVLANSLDKVMTWSGFKFIDRLGKDTFISAAYKNNTQLARTNPQKITEKWGGVFGDETQALIQDLKAGRMSDNVKLLLFNQLSDIQPITLSEMPRAYLNNPNGRIFYALKSFALKQLDIMRRDFADQVAKGNYKEGFTNLASYSASIGLAGGAVGTARDAIQTKELRLEQFDDKVFETWMSLIFANKYMRDRYLSEGEAGKAALNIITPAIFSMTDEAGKAMMDSIFQDEQQDPESFNKVISKLPVLGKISYYWLLGGAERKIERERKEEERQRRRRLGIN